MEKIELTKEKYNDWDDFCFTSDRTWYRSTSKWLEYTLNYKPEYKPKSKSFFITENKEIVAICPLILENIDGINEFSYGGYFNPVPVIKSKITKKFEEKIMKYIFEEIDNLAKEYNVKRARFRFPVLDKAFIEKKEIKYNFLIKFGYIENSYNSQVIDLKKPIDGLRQEVRHGHDSDIDRACKELTAGVFDKENISEEIFKQYISLHHKAAGRQTRPKITFDLMLEMIKEGNAFLVGAQRNGEFVGLAHFILYKNNIYYSSGCNDPEYNNFPVAHFIQWSAIEWMNSKGYDFYEIGWRNTGPTLWDFPDRKQIAIGRFKRGFGGFNVPIFQGEKYFDKEFFKKIYNERIDRFSESINQKNEE